MPVRLPSQQDTFSFIAGTHLVDRIPLTPAEITATFNGTAKIPNPYADGHLKAVNFLRTKLVGKADFPARDSQLLTNRFKSDMALSWLKELNSTMLSPLVGHPMLTSDPNCPQRQFVGVWRSIPATNTYAYAPDPALLPRILHLWLLELAQLNQQVSPKLDQAFGITKSQALHMEDTAYKASLFIATVQPFVHANNRLGRLVENALRIHWRMPWKTCGKDMLYDQYMTDLEEFQTKSLPQIVTAAQSLAGSGF